MQVSPLSLVNMDGIEPRNSASVRVKEYRQRMARVKARLLSARSLVGLTAVRESLKMLTSAPANDACVAG